MVYLNFKKELIFLATAKHINKPIMLGMKENTAFYVYSLYFGDNGSGNYYTSGTGPFYVVSR